MMIRRIVGISLLLIIFAAVALYGFYPCHYRSLVVENAKRYEVDPLLIYAMMKAESKHNTNAISRSGAKGLMQIMDKTGAWGAKEVGIEDYNHEELFQPETNIKIGCWYVSKLIRQYEGNITMVLAAYNAGTGNVAKWRMDSQCSLDGKTLYRIPFKETHAYIEKVKRNYFIYKVLYRN